MARREDELTDDRGTPCAIHAHALPKDAPKALRKLASKAELNFSGNLHWTETAFLVLTISVQLVVVYGLQQWMQRAGWSPLNQSLLIGALVGVSIAVFYRLPFVARSLRRERARRAIEAWSGFGLCPACGHDIALDLEKNELTPAEDGCATCPQCHAAWKAERFDAAIETHRKDWRREWEDSRQSSQPDSAQ